MNADRTAGDVRLAIPKGRMQEGVLGLLAAAGVPVRATQRSYRPVLPLPGFETKILKPQTIVHMLAEGSRDVGFTGADWVAEIGADLVPLLKTELDPVRLVVAAPTAWIDGGGLRPGAPFVVASEFENLTKQWLQRRGLQARFVRSYGATEVFPPEDADCIVDIVATGTTLRQNGLQIIEEVVDSATTLFANREALEDPERKRRIDELVMLLQSVLEARRRVLLEVNVGEQQLEAVIQALPAMKEPTVASLHGGRGFAVRAAVPRADLASIIPSVKGAGGTDLVVSPLSQIVP